MEAAPSGVCAVIERKMGYPWMDHYTPITAAGLAFSAERRHVAHAPLNSFSAGLRAEQAVARPWDKGGEDINTVSDPGQDPHRARFITRERASASEGYNLQSLQSVT